MHTESQKMSLKTHSSLIIGKAIKEKPPREREVHNSPLKIDVFGCFILNLICKQWGLRNRYTLCAGFIIYSKKISSLYKLISFAHSYLLLHLASFLHIYIPPPHRPSPIQVSSCRSWKRGTLSTPKYVQDSECCLLARSTITFIIIQLCVSDPRITSSYRVNLYNRCA